MKIILLGYMASGKSTVGNLLARRMYLPFIDLDNYIANKEKLSVESIFKEKGEIYFRNAEHTCLKELLNSDDSFVLSLGGGTPCYSGNMDLISASGVNAVYLKAGIKTIVHRLEENKSQRPLVADLDDDKLTEFVAKHLFERSIFYEKAMHTIHVDGKSAEDIVTEIRIFLH